MSTTQHATHARSPSGNLDNVARHDYEQTSLVRSSSGRRSESNDRPMQHVNPTRTESTRTTSGHSRTTSRYNDQPQATPTPNGTAAPETRTNSSGQTQTLRRRTTIDSSTGVWELGKTIGAGSMGKVKLARNRDTGEQVAVKIVPRQSTDNEHRSAAERERADHSKEVRTAREAAIMTLVDHPYICGMRDVVRTNYHWYMMCEYVNGGQMLDYIISHGKLKEKQARKFGRQIASALDYCHRNSIVHRDLKIENILISKTGDIKIIDFGLSNLFSPKSHLKTFCGSLYFAAPELLQAKQYTGPEVDVWSFGIVLYVLVCGKVPFDDQSMPQLHAKIKKGVVEYPPWLTPECRNLIAKMLTTDPSLRVTMTEIMGHPWMVKGFNGPPENFLPQNRKPLQLPLDSAVIDKMTGFDFGSSEHITTQLTRVIESEDYQRAVRSNERRGVMQSPEIEKKRGVFDFYKRRNSISSRDTLNTPSSEAVQLGNDPLNAFNPYISIYFLAQEKLEREAREKDPGGLEMPKEPGEKPLAVPGMPEPPQAAYTNASTYEMAGEKPTGGRSRPRARTHGEDEVNDALKNMNINAAPSPVNPAIVEPVPEQTPQKKESTAVGLLRRLSTRRHKEPEREKPDRSHPPPSLAVYSPDNTPRKSFSVRRTRDRDSSATRPDTSTSGKREELLSPPNSRTQDLKRTGGLGRSVSVNSSDIRRRLTRRGISESTRPGLTSDNSHDSKDYNNSFIASSDVESRPSSGTATRTRSVGHRRQASVQVRRMRPDNSRTLDVPEETDAEMQDELGADDAAAGNNSTNAKPVYLKGLFSVRTTSSRPIYVIRADIIRVLQQLGVEYKEIRGGFDCKHTPSIEQRPPTDEAAPSGAMPMTPPPENSHRRKISFGGFRRENSRDEFRAKIARAPSQDRHPSNTASEDDNSEYEDAGGRFGRDRTAGRSRAAGETSTHVQNDMGESMTLRFEIFVVKVPVFNLHGVQFKKVNGGTWQYKNMAQTILNELRL
ncbi:hypothetical protein AMS68_007607 [Peltaster fructicola]|uniref:non-specific serine/threonine protein kinase n=1 Tax=Peltaster fructicola TaxID=286661 RepID=A0A6H0Y663_9PEZI|nr:hypothetical protein AMS68_007607 [Peltaster fructicola]